MRSAATLVCGLAQWVELSDQREKISLALKQPMTVTQIANCTGIETRTCAHALHDLCFAGLATCLNPEAKASRLYWFRNIGLLTLRHLREKEDRAPMEWEPPTVDWRVYGSVCFRHRQAVILALSEPLQPSAIRRRATAQNPGLRMSANNTRDIIRIFLAKGIVSPVVVRKKAHPRYELTPLGRQLQALLLHATRGG